MRRALTDLVSLAGRRPGSTNLSSSLKSTRRNVQRRQNSTKTETDPSPTTTETSTTTTTNAVPPPSTGPVAAGAATPPLSTTTTTTVATAGRSRSVWKIVNSSPIGRFGGWYTKVQTKRPYATQVTSALVIYLFGDLSAQLLFPSDSQQPANKSPSEESQQSGNEEEQRASGYDPLRTLRHLTVGVVSSIPSYKWFMFLHHNFNYASKFLSISTKVAIQQAVFAPVFSTYFFTMQSLLSGASLEETWERVKKALPPSLINSFKLWPAVTAFSFMYIPPHFRSVFGGGVSVGWQTYLSWLNQKAAREVAAAEAAAAAAVAAVAPVLNPADARVSQAA